MSWKDEQSATCVATSTSLSQHAALEQDRQCRHCLSSSLLVDWAQGDRVCTSCGVVDEEHLRYEGPEWRDFNDADDLAKGLPSAARSGMVPVDETQYLGGLQPTMLSKYVYGGPTARNGQDSVHRKSLVATNNKIEYLMVKQHAQALKAAKVSRLARQSKLERSESNWEESTEEGVRLEHEQLLLREEEDVQKQRDVLYAEKWSLDRAIMLHGNDDEQSSPVFSLRLEDRETQRQDLLQQLDAPLRRAAFDLYRAYAMLRDANHRLHLPDRVLHEASSMLCRYATRRDGISVKGVSSRWSNKNKTVHRKNKSTTQADVNQKDEEKRLSEFNRAKQMGSLGSALLFLTARNLGWTRSLVEVCASFQLEGRSNHDESSVEEAFIKPKHCSKAMSEVRSLFPDFARPAGPEALQTRHGLRDNVSVANFVDHTVRKLDLPPVAVASVRTLVTHYRRKQLDLGLESGTKLSTLAASMAFLVCSTGAAMQRLAKQTQSTGAPQSREGRKRFAEDTTEGSRHAKMAKMESNKTEVRAQQQLPSDRSSLCVPFDVFSSASVEQQPAEQTEYEMRRVWDAWSEQMPWFRPIGRIEQSCGVSRSVILNHYREKVFPQRGELLEVLRDSLSQPSDLQQDEGTLRDTPLSTILLSNVAVAASLLDGKGKT